MASGRHLLKGAYAHMNAFVKTPAEKIPDSLQKILALPQEKKYIMVADEETGKVKGLFPLKSKNLGTGWIALYQDPSIWLAQQRLTGEQFKVMHVLFGKLDFNNYLRISRQDIADIIGIQPVNVSRAMKKLKELKIILEGPPAGKFKTYRLNPYIAHKGAERDDTIKHFESSISKK